MKKVISIGIDNAKGMIGLQAAASGAEEFAEWAESQGYEVEVFTDRNGHVVTQNEIYISIQNCILSKNYNQIIIFFSGHGILKSPNQELWLLTNAKSNPNESINLTGSIDNARTSGVPYIVFISDACRVLPTELQLTGAGSVIFPICDDVCNDCNVDIYYATRPGSAANEMSSTENFKKFGIFTECLLEGLRGKYKEVLEHETNGNSYSELVHIADSNEPISIPCSFLIRSPKLKSLLQRTIPLKAHAKSIRLNQVPEIRIEFSDTNYLARHQLLLTQDFPDKFGTIDPTSVHTEDSYIRKQKYMSFSLQSDSAEFIASRKTFSMFNLQEGNYEFATGFTVIGGTILDIIVPGGKREIFFSEENQQVKVEQNVENTSALIILKNGQSVPAIVIKDFIGNIVLDKNQILTINYTPSIYNDKYWEYSENKNQIKFARAIITAFASEGFNYKKILKDQFTENGELKEYGIGSFLRTRKSLDPSLGIYAAYAYRQDGKQKEIRSVANYMIDDGNLIFDVIMLAEKLKDFKERVKPFCPMLSLGWAYINRFEQYLHPSIKEVSSNIVPGLWTTFDERGTQIISTLIEQNVL